jgi:YjbE family integral membrane protein
MTWEFLARWLSIVVLDLTLAGDNAVVIAMAVRSLPAKQQKKGIFWGAFGAVGLRVAVTFIAAQLLRVPFLQLGGGLLLLWIAWKLLRQPPGAGGEHHIRETAGLFEAIKIIVLADFIMSTDNMLAVAAASHGSFFLLIFGLGLSIPIILFGSALVAKLMNKYPWLVLLGAAILGWVAGEMIVADRLVHVRIEPVAQVAQRTVPLFLAVVVVVGRWQELTGRLRARRAAAAFVADCTCPRARLLIQEGAFCISTLSAYPKRCPCDKPSGTPYRQRRYWSIWSPPERG